MHNKKTSAFFQRCSSNSMYYRSVKYRVNKTTISQPQSLSKMTRDERNQSIDHPYSSNGKISKFKRYKKKISYLQTWRTLLNTIQLKTADCKLGPTTQSVRLPIIRQQQKSIFSVLSPLPSPIQFLKEQIKKNKTNITDSQLQMNKIRAGMGILRSQIEKQLEQTNQQIINRIGILRQTIGFDQIRQQQLKLRSKRQLKDLFKDHQQIKSIFQINKQRINKLQQAIFDNRPFQLEIIHQNQAQQTIPKYF